MYIKGDLHIPKIYHILTDLIIRNQMTQQQNQPRSSKDNKQVITHSKSMVLKNKKKFGHFFFNSLDLGL